jgi:protein-arginine kinase activator protein McsA
LIAVTIIAKIEGTLFVAPHQATVIERLEAAGANPEFKKAAELRDIIAAIKKKL